MEDDGGEMISLCSKTYSAKSETVEKYSSKGLNKKSNINAHELMKTVLDTGVPQGGVNTGIRYLDGGRTVTYKTHKLAFSNMYGKRVLLSDQISTEPLPGSFIPFDRAREEGL